MFVPNCGEDEYDNSGTNIKTCDEFCGPSSSAAEEDPLYCPEVLQRPYYVRMDQDIEEYTER